MHPSRRLILAGTVVGAASLGLAFLVVPDRATIDGLRGAGWPAAAMLGVVAIVAVVGDRREGFSPAAAVGLTLVAAVATVFSIQKLVDAAIAARRLTALGIPAATGPGPWVLIVGSVTVLVGAAVGLSRRLG